MWLALGAVYALAVALRLLRAGLPDDSFYPDDIYQMLEQAHRLVFGYGYQPWEFQVGIRSWLLPGLMGGVLKGLAALGFDRPELYGPAVTGLAILLSLTLIEASRRAARRLGGERAGLIAALAVAVYTPCIAAAQKITPEIVAGYAFAAALAASLGADRRSALWSGLLAGIVAGLRIHYGPALVVLAAIAWLRRDRRWPDLAVFLAAGAFAFSIFGVVDWLTWGAPFLSYVNGVRANIGHDVAAFFGVMPVYFYLQVFAVGAILALFAALDWRRTGWLLVPVLVIVAVHSLIGHKEPRFIFAIHGPIMAALGVFLAGRLQHPLIMSKQHDRKAAAQAIEPGAISSRPDDAVRSESALDKGREGRLLAGVVIALLVATSLKSFVLLWRDPGNTASISSDYRTAVLALRREPDVRAVASYGIDYFWFPGCYWLHEDVPVQFVRRLPASSAEIPAGISHVFLPVGAPPLPGFSPVGTYGLVELRHRDEIDPAAPLPPIDRSLPLTFSWDKGIHDAWWD